jgi:hypothetical protein
MDLFKRIHRALYLTFRAVLHQIQQAIGRNTAPWQHYRPEAPQRWRQWVHPRFVFRLTTLFIVVYFIFVAIAGHQIYSHHRTKLSTFMERIFPYPAAYVNSEIIFQNRLEWEMSVRLFNLKIHSLPGTENEVEKYTVTQISNRILYRQALSKNGYIISASDIDKELQSIADQSDGMAKLAIYLKDNYGPAMTMERFRIWIGDGLAESAVQQQLLERVYLKHIVIGYPSGATAAQIEAARVKAQKVRDGLTSADQFDAAAKQYSDDLASRDRGGDIGATIRGVRDPAYFTEDFEKQVFALKVGDISQPILSPSGWHIVLLTKKEGSIPLSLADYTKQLRESAKIRLLMGK